MKKPTHMQLSIIFILALASGISLAGPFNGIHPLQSDRFIIGLGEFFPDISGRFAIDDPDGGDGSDVDFQDDAGLDDKQTLPAFAITWRLSNNSRVQGEYFSLGQDGKRELTKTINVGDLEFAAGAQLSSDMDLDIVRAFYGYSFIKNDNTEVGAGLGLHYINIDVSLSGIATINGEEIANAKRGIDEGAILPNIGGYASYAFSPKWAVGARVDWISANIDKYDGTLWNVEAAVQYQMFEHFGLGLAYRYLDFELATEDSKKGDWKTEFEYSGPLLFFTANF
jgi:hypothetical protein